MPRVTVVSGWAGRAAFFPGLTAQGEHIAPFVDASPGAVLSRLTGGGVVVGWSTGAHILLGDLARLSGLYDCVVLVAPFAAFSRCAEASVLETMTANMTTAAQRTVRSFYRNCGIRGAATDWVQGEAPALTEGLRFLARSTVEAIPADVTLSNVVLIGGAADRIVPPAETERVAAMAPGASLQRVDAGHFITEEVIADVVLHTAGCRLL
jgi:pimeloyl-ACP methyl ester carboxylesterase